MNKPKASTKARNKANHETSESNNPKETSTIEAQSSFTPGAFDDFLNRVSTVVSDGGAPKTIRRRMATVTIDHRLCEPGLFEEPFQLTVEGLSSDDELAALNSSSDGQSIAFNMTLKSIREFNGRKLKKHEVQVLWEALGLAGRIAVLNAFMRHCTGADEDLLGKSLSAVVVG